MGVYAGVTDDYLTQSDQTGVADAVEKYRLWSLSKEGDPGRTPALDLNFAENKSLVDDISGNNLITFTRSSAATYVGADGLIKTAGLNLFTNSGLPFSDGRSPNGSVDDINVYEGTADQFSTILISGNQNHSYISVTSGTSYTLSFYAKSGTGSSAVVEFVTNVGASASNQATIGLSQSGGRVSAILTATLTGSIQVRFGSQGSGLTYSLGGIQVEVGDTATVYADTASSTSGAPRFDHDPDTGESLGLLIEESSTNEWSNSESMIQSTYVTVGYTLPGGLTNPAGGSTAVKILSGSTRTWWNRGTGGFAVTSGDYWTMSWWAYSTNQSVDFGNSDYFNVANTTISQDKTVSAGQWKRCYRTVEFTASGSPQIRFMPYNYTLYTDTNNEVFVWGFQFEKKAFPTSYIPTSGSTATRTPDLTSITGSNLTSWYNVSEGTLYVDYKGEVPGGATGGYFGTNVNGWGVYSNDVRITNKGRTDFSPDRGAYNISNKQVSLYRGAISQSDIVGKTSYAVNGTLYATDADRLGPYTTPLGFSVSAADVGAASQTRGSFTVKRTMYWGLKLSNSTLQSITE